MITVTIYTPQELNHSSYALKGLFDLEKEGLIRLKVKLLISGLRGRLEVEGQKLHKSQSHFKKAVFLKINSCDHTYNVCLDFDDIPTTFSIRGLSTCDFYFKRSYQSQIIDVVSQSYPVQLKTLGLPFKLNPEFKRNRITFLVGLLLSNMLQIKINSSYFTRLSNEFKAQLKHWRSIKKTRKLDDFKRVRGAENKVFYVKRLFPSNSNADVVQLHNQRIDLLTTLKKDLGDNFFGGIQASKMAQELCPDLILKGKTNEFEFLQLLIKCNIVVYTRGLQFSTGWTLPEYLSMGKAIVAEQLYNQMPVPLHDGHHALFFNDYEDCINKCRQLLDNPVFVNDLSSNAYDYFQQFVTPIKGMHRILFNDIEKIEI